MIKAPVPLGLKVRAPLAPVATVRAPESAMLLVVKVSEPITVPVMKVPTPALVILVVPFKVRLPAVIAASPVVTVRPALPVRSPAEVIVPEPVVEILPEVDRVPEVLTVSWPEEPTERREAGLTVPIPTFPVAKVAA